MFWLLTLYRLKFLCQLSQRRNVYVFLYFNLFDLNIVKTYNDMSFVSA